MRLGFGDPWAHPVTAEHARNAQRLPPRSDATSNRRRANIHTASTSDYANSNHGPGPHCKVLKKLEGRIDNHATFNAMQSTHFGARHSRRRKPGPTTTQPRASRIKASSRLLASRPSWRNWKVGATNSGKTGGTVLHCMFKTGHALPLTFVRFLRPRIIRGNHAKCPRRRRAEMLIHGPNHVFDLGLSHPQPRTRQSLVRFAHTDWSEKRPCPRSVRIHGLSLATDRRETGSFLAQAKGSQRTDAGSELIHASKRSCPTGEIIHAAFSPRSLQSSHKELTSYVLI